MNPNHLVLGTARSNSIDAVRKGRVLSVESGQDAVEKLNGISALQRKMTCKAGHLLAGSNLYRSPGRRRPNGYRLAQQRHRARLNPTC